MDWTPIPREDLEARIAEGLAPMDDAVRDAWNAMRIEPEKWQCSPWGDEGGGFWAVAIRDGEVVWFDDVEEDFAISPFTQHGKIDVYGGWVGRFEDLLLSLPEAQAAESWGYRSPETEVPPDLVTGGTIVRRQTTYWEVRSSRGALWRVHFRGKVEARFVQPEFEGMELTDRHPLLSEYAEPWVDVYFSRNSPGSDIRPSSARGEGAEVLPVAALRARIAMESEGWRTLDEYLNPAADPSRGHGLLMRAPGPIAKIAAEEMQSAGYSVSTFEGRAAQEIPKALILGQNAILAKAFRFDALGS